jgi:hypothetical protein
LPTPGDDIIRYDGRILTVNVRPPIQVEARRGRRWKWFGQKGWWVRLSLFPNWESKKFVCTLAEAGVFLKHDPDSLPWIEEPPSGPAISDPSQTSSSLKKHH